MCKRTQIYYVLQTVFKNIQKHKIKLKVDGYMKNCGKKNETDRLDCYVPQQASQAGTDPTVRICGVSQQSMCRKILRSRFMDNSLILMRSQIFIVVS